MELFSFLWTSPSFFLVQHHHETMEKPEPEPGTEVTDKILEPEEPISEAEQEPQEKHYTIFYGDTGHSYEAIIGPYLKGAKEVTVEDPYIRATHQIQNFVRFCETVVRLSTIRKINLITSYDDNTNISDMRDNLDDIKQSLLEIDVILDIKLNPNMPTVPRSLSSNLT